MTKIIATSSRVTMKTDETLSVSSSTKTPESWQWKLEIDSAREILNRGIKV